MDERLAEYLRARIVTHRESPGVVADGMRLECLEYAVCAKTIYNLIDRDLVPGVSNESLWEKRKRRKTRKTLHRRRKQAVEPGHSIESRPEQIELRQEAGHWEIDLVVEGRGRGTTALLTLIERKTRKQIIPKLKDKTQKAVARAIHGIEQKPFERSSKASRRITAASSSTMKPLNARGRADRVLISTTPIPIHPGMSGSNENANRMIRRFIPKGCDISKYTCKQILAIEDWLNNYPRKILDFETAEERFIQELVA